MWGWRCCSPIFGQDHLNFKTSTQYQGSQAFASSGGTEMVNGRVCYQMPLSIQVIPSIQWCEGVALSLDDDSRLLIIQVTQLGSHQCRNIGCRLKLQIGSFNLGGLCKKIKKMTELVLATSNSQWVGDLFNHHQQTPLRHGGHFWPGNRYLPALSSNQITNLRGSHKLPQPRAAKTDLWEYTISWAHPEMAKKCCGDSGWFWWAHWGHTLSHMCKTTPKSSGPCLSNTRFNRCRVRITQLVSQAT